MMFTPPFMDVFGTGQIHSWDELLGLRSEHVPLHPRVLLVDDDPIFCKTIARAAKQQAIDVVTCSSMEEFDRLLSQDPYDVALVDYYFGDRTAPELLHLFDENVPVVLISETKKNSARGLV